VATIGSTRTFDAFEQDLNQDQLLNEQFQNTRLTTPNEGLPQTQAQQHEQVWVNTFVPPPAAPALVPVLAAVVFPVHDPSSTTADCQRGRFVTGQRRNCPRGSSERRQARSRSRSKERKVQEGTEEEWKLRIKKRNDGLNNLWNHEMYKMNPDIQDEDRPFCPNPNDRTLSKRDWEKKLGKCRGKWRKLHNVRRKLVPRGFAKEDAEAAWDQANERVEKEEEAKPPKDKMSEEDRTKKTLKHTECILNTQHLVQMGVSKRKAERALTLSNGDFNQAVQIIFGQ